jgi:endonuclease/exonuclease/phosphatase (EEP) superfamily protein YafD
LRNRYLHYLARVIFSVLAIIALGATLIPLLPFEQWFIRVFDYPRLQTFFIALVALIWYFIFYFKKRKRGYTFMLMFLVVAVVQGYKAVPYTPLGKKQVLTSEVDPNDTTFLRILISNVLQENNDYQALIDEVNKYKPDLFVTTESDTNWQEALKAIEEQFPYRVPVPLDNTYGMHLYSRLPLKDTKVRYLLEPDIPSIKTKLQLSNGEWITVFTVHPRPPVPGESSDSRERDAEIIMLGKEAREAAGGVVVAGDFNDVAWSETTELFQEVTGFLDPRRGRGFYNTFHAKYPIFRWPLDHIFISPHWKLIKMERGSYMGSDHFPVYVQLSYEPEEKQEQPKVKPDSNTENEANETIQDGIEDDDAPGE